MHHINAIHAPNQNSTGHRSIRLSEALAEESPNRQYAPLMPCFANKPPDRCLVIPYSYPYGPAGSAGQAFRQ